MKIKQCSVNEIEILHHLGIQSNTESRYEILQERLLSPDCLYLIVQDENDVCVSKCLFMKISLFSDDVECNTIYVREVYKDDKFEFKIDAMIHLGINIFLNKNKNYEFCLLVQEDNKRAIRFFDRIGFVMKSYSLQDEPLMYLPAYFTDKTYNFHEMVHYDGNLIRDDSSRLFRPDRSVPFYKMIYCHRHK
jgi:hypothetical protein